MVRVQFVPNKGARLATGAFRFRVLQLASDGNKDTVVGGQTFVMKEATIKPLGKK